MKLNEMHLFMDIDDQILFEGAGQEVSLRRESFINVMKQDLADATGIRPCFAPARSREE